MVRREEWDYFHDLPDEDCPVPDIADIESPCFIFGGGPIFYLLWTGQLKHLKVGKADDFKYLLSRLAERRRQCGDTKLLGFKFCQDPREEESVWQERFADHAVAREVFDLSSWDNDYDPLTDFGNERKIMWDSFPHPDHHMAWVSRALEAKIKEYLQVKWKKIDCDNWDRLMSLCSKFQDLDFDFNTEWDAENSRDVYVILLPGYPLSQI